MIIATAGHIDHGKTLLVKTLTGVDTDRLPEEKARGISIDLGFAYWKTGGGDTIGFVDVPGHERFIRNMLAGVCGIDYVMLIVAADDGGMAARRCATNLRLPRKRTATVNIRAVISAMRSTARSPSPAAAR